MWDRKAINFSCFNAGTEDSYGCRDYIKKIFKKYIEESLLVDIDDEDDKNDDEGQMQMCQPKLEKKKSSGIWSKMFGNVDEDDLLIAQLVNMGFEVTKATRSLKQANNNLEKAIEIIEANDNPLLNFKGP